MEQNGAFKKITVVQSQLAHFFYYFTFWSRIFYRAVCLLGEMLSKTYFRIALNTNAIALFFGAIPFKYRKTGSTTSLITSKKLIFRSKIRLCQILLYTGFLGCQAYANRGNLAAFNFAILFTYIGILLSISCTFFLLNGQDYCDTVNMCQDFLSRHIRKWLLFQNCVSLL